MGASTNDGGDTTERRRRRKGALVGLIGLTAALAVAGTVRTLGSSSDKVAAAGTAATTSTAVAAAATSTVAASTTAAAATTAPATTAADTTIAPTTTASPGSTAPAAPAPAVATVAPTSPTAPTAAAPAEPFDPTSLDKPVRWAVFSGGQVTLHGRIPTSAAAETIARKAAAIVGPANVTVDYTIDPAAPLVASGPLYVGDTVLFASESTTIGPEFQSLLDLGRALMAQNPKVSITVIGRADGQGEPGYNLRLSQQRAQAAVDYLAEGLDDPGRLTAVGLGNQAPVGDDADAAGRQANRSVEFVITGLLDD